jgi:hypothetical protein
MTLEPLGHVIHKPDGPEERHAEASERIGEARREALLLPIIENKDLKCQET